MDLRRITTFCAALPLLAAAASAWAEDIPGSVETRAQLRVDAGLTAGVWEEADDRDWYLVRLQTSRDYVVYLRSIDTSRLNLSLH